MNTVHPIHALHSQTSPQAPSQTSSNRRIASASASLTWAVRCTLALALSCSTAVHAQQNNLGNQLLQGVFDALKKQAPPGLPVPSVPSAPSASPVPANIPDGMVPPPRPVAAEPVAAYPTLAVFLDATRQGAFVGVADINGQAQDVLARSMISVLRHDYGVAPLPGNTACFESFKGQALSLLTWVTAIHVASLGRQAPNFVNANADTRSESEALASELNHLRQAGGWCDAKVLGQSVPHPYKQALPRLLTDYGRATSQWVEMERTRRQMVYQTQQEQIRLEAEQRQRELQARETQRRADEQNRIDAERARIEREQKQREQRDKSRVGG